MRRQPPNREAGIAMPWLAAIVAGALLIVGGGAYALAGGFGSDGKPSASAAPSAKSTQAVAAEPTLGEMMAEVKSGSEQLLCTFQVEDGNHQMYIKSFNLFRIDVHDAGGKPISHVLRDGTTVHVWQPDAAIGVSMPFIENKAPDGAPDDPAKLTPEALEEHGDGTPVSCEPYSGDQTVYSLPGSVSFKPLTDVTGPTIP